MGMVRHTHRTTTIDKPAGLKASSLSPGPGLDFTSTWACSPAFLSRPAAMNQPFEAGPPYGRTRQPSGWASHAKALGLIMHTRTAPGFWATPVTNP